MRAKIQQLLGLSGSKKDRFYDVEGIQIKLPHHHKLDVFQKHFPRYDKLMVTISQNLPKNAAVIDVGANIGDSSVLFLKQNLKTICVEPTDEFYKYLEDNVGKNRFSNNAILLKKFISNSNTAKKITLADGTASISKSYNNEVSEGTISQNDIIPLDKVPSIVGINEAISFIKIDTDGYDYSVIDSGLNLLQKDKALLYFENEISLKNVDLYASTYQSLDGIGYKKVWIFDNFGDLLIAGGTWNDLLQLNAYLLQSNANTINYYDILTCSAEKEELLNIIISKYFDEYQRKVSKEVLLKLKMIK